MTPGNLELVEVVISMTVNTAGVAGILHVDGRGDLGAFRRAGSWLPATSEAAVLGAFLFGWLYGGPALVIHFVKSRRSLVGLLLGVYCALDVIVTDIAAQLAAAAAIDRLGL